MKKLVIKDIISGFTALVWIINGFYCKLLNQVPRHEEIVARILGPEFSRELTILIGFMEIVMATWIISRFKARLNAIVQIIVIGVMNALEFFLVPDLLLWGKYNALFAILFMGIIYVNEFHLNQE